MTATAAFALPAGKEGKEETSGVSNSETQKRGLTVNHSSTQGTDKTQAFQ